MDGSPITQAQRITRVYAAALNGYICILEPKTLACLHRDISPGNIAINTILINIFTISLGYVHTMLLILTHARFVEGDDKAKKKRHQSKSGTGVFYMGDYTVLLDSKHSPSLRVPKALTIFGCSG